MKDLILINENILSTEDKSSDGMSRVRITFKNGFQLSVIRGLHSYGGDDGFFEIAIFDKSGNMNGYHLNDSYEGDDVRGYLDVEQVNEYIQKVGNLT